jgi:hypothetical protein
MTLRIPGAARRRRRRLARLLLALELLASERKNASVRNHYVTLGLWQDASPREIVSAYRRLARKLHPDLHPDDPLAAEEFRAVQEAYDTLADQQARRRYDAELAALGVIAPSAAQPLAPPTKERRPVWSPPRRTRRRPSLLPLAIVVVCVVIVAVLERRLKTIGVVAAPALVLSALVIFLARLLRDVFPRD